MASLDASAVQRLMFSKRRQYKIQRMRPQRFQNFSSILESSPARALGEKLQKLSDAGPMFDPERMRSVRELQASTTWTSYMQTLNARSNQLIKGQASSCNQRPDLRSSNLFLAYEVEEVIEDLNDAQDEELGNRAPEIAQTRHADDYSDPSASDDDDEAQSVA